MSKVSERDLLRKCYTRMINIVNLKGVASRSLNSIETAEKAIKDLFDEYADLKYSSLKEELKKFIKENQDLKVVNDKLSNENCKLNREKALLIYEKDKLIAEKDNLNDVVSQYRKIVIELENKINYLQEENEFLAKPWYKKFLGI